MSLSLFYVELDECKFLTGSVMFEKDNFNYPGTLDFDYNKETNTMGLVTIKVTKRIGDKEYDFFSPPCSNPIDDLRIRIEFLKSVVVHYNDQNPSEYSFEFR